MVSLIKDNFLNRFLPLIIIVVAIFVLPLLAVHGIWIFLRGVWLNYRFRSRWNSKGKHILFIYSESPNWQNYIETNIVPLIEDKSVFLNWSKRSEWNIITPFEAKMFFYWCGDSEFNPMAIVFAPNWKVKTIRFHKAFKDHKHGNNNLLKEKEAELYSYL